MTSTLSTAASRTDDADLTALGYEPTLHRKLGRYASFAAGFSFVSILTTIFQLFAFGYSFAGPAFFWTWPVVLVGQLLVALNFAELAARYPLSGAVYQWSRRMGGEVVGWFAGWFMSIAQVITAAAAAIALQVVLPQLWDGFQVVGGDPALTSPTGAANAVILGAILLVITTVINCLGVKLMSHVNSIGVTCEIVGVAAVILALFSAAQRGPEVVADVSVVTTSDLGAVGAFLVSGLMAAYVMVGFNSAGELSEETKNPRKTAPRTILSALIISGVGGGLMIIAALMAAPSLDDGRLATEGLPYVLTAVLGTFWGKVLLVDVAIAIFVCTLAIQTAGSRLVFSMARDGKLPASALLAKVHSQARNPHVALHRHRRPGCGNPRHQHRQLRTLHHPLQRVHRDGVPGVPDGHGTAAAQPFPGRLGPGRADHAGRALLAGPLGLAGQHSGRAVWRPDGHQPFLAPPRSVRPLRRPRDPALLRPHHGGRRPAPGPLDPAEHPGQGEQSRTHRGSRRRQLTPPSVPVPAQPAPAPAQK